ncbi:MAG: ABC transporter permease subunit, partial [Planctomycetota bacterium]
MSNIYQIGLMTYRESVRQPLLYIIIAVSAILIFLAPLFSLFAFGEELSMVREVGLAAITFGLILITVLTANQVITLEIERLTVMMLFSKPVRRSEFILGKFVGIAATLLLTAVILGLVFIAVYWYKEGRPQIALMVSQGKTSGAALFQFLQHDGLLLA